jgi:hypothetical protein
LIALWASREQENAISPEFDFSARRSRTHCTHLGGWLDRPDGLQLSVSPDERYVLLTRLDSSGTDLQLVNNFR